MWCRVVCDHSPAFGRLTSGRVDAPAWARLAPEVDDVRARQLAVHGTIVQHVQVPGTGFPKSTEQFIFDFFKNGTFRSVFFIINTK